MKRCIDYSARNGRWTANHANPQFRLALIGIYQSCSVKLSRIAGKIPGTAKLLCYPRRLSRWLENPAIDVRAWYEPVARSWLERQAAHQQQIWLVVDATKVGFAR